MPIESTELKDRKHDLRPLGEPGRGLRDLVVLTGSIGNNYQARATVRGIGS